jgi:hypothetical protein
LQILIYENNNNVAPKPKSFLCFPSPISVLCLCSSFRF